MGFFDGLGRLVSGKPVFENPQQAGHADANVAAPANQNSDATRDEHGGKVIPHIELEEFKSEIENGHHLMIEVWIKNPMRAPIRIDEIELLGSRQTPNYELAPGQARQFILYKGEAPKNESDNKAWITYRWMSNTDQFRQQYRMRYKYNNGLYEVEEFIKDVPVRDI